MRPSYEGEENGAMIKIATEPNSLDQRRVGVMLSGLNYLSLWRDRTVVIKYGGAAMGRDELRTSFARDVARLRAAGVHPVIVHGGGPPQIDTLMRRLGKTPRFVDGLRVTDDETMELVEMGSHQPRARGAYQPARRPCDRSQRRGLRTVEALAARGDSMTRRVPAEYMKPFALECSATSASALDSPNMGWTPAG
jgi:hypothetical protein